MLVLRIKICRKLIPSFSLALLGWASFDYCHHANAGLNFTLSPDVSNNVVLEISTFGVTNTDSGAGSMSTLLDPALAGESFVNIGGGNPFGSTYSALTATSDASIQAFALATPLEILFGGASHSVTGLTFEDDGVGPDADDFSFGFNAFLPSSNVAYTVVGTGPTTLLDTNNVLGNGVNAPVPFTDLNTGIYSLPTDPGSQYLNGFTLTIEPIPEPSTILGTAAALGFGAFLFMQERNKKHKHKNSQSASVDSERLGV